MLARLAKRTGSISSFLYEQFSYAAANGYKQLVPMKICSYCGRENVDNAMNCQECGTSMAPAPSPLKTLRAPQHQGIRVLIACGVWMIISGVSLYVSWKNAAHSAAWHSQSITQRQLTAIGEAITAYQGKFHACPTNHQSLEALTNEAPAVVGWYMNERWLDGWGHPLVLVSTGPDCFVMTYGDDGKPGGIGIDYDITSKTRTLQKQHQPSPSSTTAEQQRG